MSIDIYVQRGDGSSLGEDIVDSLLGTIPAAIVRGRNELDDNGGYFAEVDDTLPFIANLETGKLIQVEDIQLGIVWIGKIVNISHDITDSNQITKLHIMRKK